VAALVLCLAGAEAALVVARGAFAAGLLAVALDRSSLGTGVLAAFCAWQMSAVWRGTHAPFTEK
jgi:hypothetical protein